VSRDSVLALQDLCVYFPLKRGAFRRSRQFAYAVDGVTESVGRGEILALVGESGCGKTTVARAVLGLTKPTSGSIMLQGVDMAQAPHKVRQEAGAGVQVVFQDPASSLSPRMTVHDIVAEPARTRGRPDGESLKSKVLELLDTVGLDTQHLWRRPHEFSGGQCQRIAIARALASDPYLVVLDEPTSALDVSVQARILTLLSALRDARGISFLLITHDLAVAQCMADRVAVMYLGRIVEKGPTHAVLSNPLHPYSVALLASVPSPDPTQRSGAAVLGGEVPSPVNPPTGCRFHPRCPQRTDICSHTDVRLREVSDGRSVACHLAPETPVGA